MVAYNSMFSSVRLYSQLKVDGRSYTENGLHRCTPESIRQFGPDSDYELTLGPLLVVTSGIHPETGYEFSRIKLPFGALYDAAPDDHHVWSDLIQELKSAAFMVLPLNDNAYNGLDMLCCWIDGVRIVTQRGPQTNIEIDFHVDWWLTMGDRVTFGAGRILRGPQSLARPDPTQPRLWVQDSAVPLGASRMNDCWIILTYVETDSDEKITSIKSYFWQVSGTITYGGDDYNCPGIGDVLMGKIEETLALSSGSIQGVWLSPIQPFNPSDVYVYRNPPAPPAVGNGGAVYECIYPQGTYGEVVNIGAEDVMTSDDEKYMISDVTGSIYYTTPWGLPFKSIRMKVDVGTQGADLMIYFQESTDTDHDKGAEGRFVTLPLPGLPVTSNALSDYVYSGQRDYDIRIREIQREQAAVNGIAGIGTSAIGGAVAGSMAAPGPGTVAGAIAGVVSGTVGTAVGYVSSGHYDRKTQEAVDKLMASQVNNVIMPAQGYAGLKPFAPFGWNLLKMVRDSVSAAEISNEHNELGYVTDSYSADCSTVISDGGGLKIEGLEVLGAGPEVTRYIENIFARGVHIDIPNP